jgi:hypothetical protein
LNKRLFYKVTTFLFALISGFKVNFVGQLGANEILAVLGSASLKTWRKLYSDIPDLKKVNIGYLLFLVFQMLSDLINHSSIENMMRGQANIIFAVIVTNFLARMIWKSSDAIIYYFIGSMLSTMIWKASNVEDIGLDQMSVFKFTLVPMMNSGMLIVTWYLLRKNILSKMGLASVLVAYGVFCIAFDARSNGMVFVVLSLLFFFNSRIPRITFKNALTMLGFLAVVFQTLFSIYVSQVLSGQIGGSHSKKQLEMLENPYNPMNLLIRGRSETYVALLAIGDKPIFGHGSWAPDPGGKYTYMVLKLHNDEETFDGKFERANGKFIIPSHSIIFGSWISAGIGGVLAILFVMYTFYRRAFAMIVDPDIQYSEYTIILFYFMIYLAWTFLFSPLPHIKQSIPIMLAFVLVIYRKYELIRQEDEEEEESEEESLEIREYSE